ncbi:unnamed protein product [Sphagnum jensenii]
MAKNKTTNPFFFLNMELMYLQRTSPSATTTAESLHRNDFPNGFVFGTSSSSYQFEGAVKEGGRGPSIWDTASHIPGVIADNSTGDVTTDQYHRYKEDVELLVQLGVDAYRFSIAWSRIFPDGKGPIANKEGIAYYNRLIDALLENGIQPYVTLFHFDLPQAFQDSFGGWRSPLIVPLYVVYAETCFATFGDRVKNWATFNEPHLFAYKYYNYGCVVGNCKLGMNNMSWPYITMHHMLLSHAATFQVYKSKFQANQGGVIGIILDAQWYEPYSNSQEDIEAIERMQMFQVQWILDPIYFGKYPTIMQEQLGDLLPSLSPSESKALKGTVDFLGINHYTSHYTINQPNSSIPPSKPMYRDTKADTIEMKNGVYIGPKAASDWLYIVPWGIQKMLNYIKVRYNNPTIYITENGVDEQHNNYSMSLEVLLQDQFRIKFHHDYLSYLIAAIRDGCDVRGYFTWSFLDNFEWEDGIEKRFGFYYVDYTQNNRRYPKASVKWFKQFLCQTSQSKQLDI